MGYGPTSNYEFFYQGTASPLDPNYGSLFLGYRVPFSYLQLHTNPQNSNIAAETSDRLSSGVKGVMVNVLDSRTFESIPKQLFEDVRSLHKLVGGEPSLHAPVINPSGFTKEGWSEASREEAERKISSYLDKAHLMDPTGNIPVTIHASDIPGMQWWKKAPEGDKSVIYAVNTDTHQIAPLEYEEKYLPGKYNSETGEGGPRKQIYTPEDKIDMTNNTHWHNSLVEVNREKIHADRVLEESFPTLAPVWDDIEKVQEGKMDYKDLQLTQSQQQALAQVQDIMPIYKDMGMKLDSTFSDAYEYYSDKIKETSDSNEKKRLQHHIASLKEMGNNMFEAQTSQNPVLMHNSFSRALQELSVMTKIDPPKKYVSVEDFSRPKSAETLANAALSSFKRYGEKAPVIALENSYPYLAFSRADSLKGLIQATREKFIEKAQNAGYSHKDAENAANKLIGATWDVGHIHQLKASGYSKEDVIEETKKIAPFVKFSHLTDNFGYEDSHLPPGMGEVPIKEMLKELEKSGKLKHVIEAGGLLGMGRGEAGKLIFPSTLEALGSKVYSCEPTGPFWNQLPYLESAYNMGMGRVFPEQHVSMYGGGFSSLPSEVGGVMPGRGGSFSGTPME